MKKFCVLVLTFLLACISFCGCGLLDDSGSSTTSRKYEFTQALTMSVEYSELLDYYTAEITGILKNTSSRDYSYVSLEFSILDADGNKIDTAYDSVSELKSGATWKFKATSLTEGDKPVRFELADVTMW